MSWPYRILFVVTLVFFLPALSLGTVSPVVAKLAVDRLKSYKRTGTAIGQVYAWGMVGSILGTFLTGFFLIDTFGTKGVVLLIGTTMAFGATLLGSVWHAVWAGIPLGLCVLAFTPPAFVDAIGKVVPCVKGNRFEDIGERWGIREQPGNPDVTKSDFAWIDESNYYYIKVENQVEGPGRYRETHAGARQPDPRLLHPRPSRTARLRLRTHLRPGRLSRGQGQRQRDLQAHARTGKRRGQATQPPAAGANDKATRPRSQPSRRNPRTPRQEPPSA